MITHIFDTSALLAHYFDEDGSEQVQRIWEEHPETIGVCVVTIPEFRGRLRAEIDNSDEIQYAAERYFSFLTQSIQIDRAVAELTDHVRVTAIKRIPLIDALIAACARAADALLVHKDPHFMTLPKNVVNQLYLGD